MQVSHEIVPKILNMINEICCSICLFTLDHHPHFLTMDAQPQWHRCFRQTCKVDHFPKRAVASLSIHSLHFGLPPPCHCFLNQIFLVPWLRQRSSYFLGTQGLWNNGITKGHFPTNYHLQHLLGYRFADVAIW